MFKIKKIIKRLVVFTTAVASILSMSVCGYATVSVTYKPVYGYKRIPMGTTNGVLMSYSVNTTKQSATCSYKFDYSTGVPNGTKTIYIGYEYIIPNKNSLPVSVKTNYAEFHSSNLLSGNAVAELSAAQISAGYKIQFISFNVNCITGTYNPFWLPSYK